MALPPILARTQGIHLVLSLLHIARPRRILQVRVVRVAAVVHVLGRVLGHAVPVDVLQLLQRADLVFVALLARSTAFAAVLLDDAVLARQVQHQVLVLI